MVEFSLLAPRGQVSNEDKEAVFNELVKIDSDHWRLMDYTDFDEQTVSSSLMAYIQVGRVVYDLDKGLYQKEPTRDLDMDQLRFTSPEEEEALELLQQEAISDFRTNVIEVEEVRKGKAVMSKRYVITATVTDNDNIEETRLVLNESESVNRTNRMYLFDRGWNTLKQGLCRHVLGLRLELNQRIDRGFVLWVQLKKYCKVIQRRWH